jgi:precorrin-6B methylase 1
MTKRARHISIVGAGILSPNQLTLEADAALRRSSVVFCLLTLTARMRRYLAALPGATVDLDPLYRDGSLDVSVYRRVADVVVNAATKHRRVSFLVAGHPLLYVSPAALILEQAKQRGIATSVCAGVSSIDTMIVQLNLELANNGMQMFECNRFLYHHVKPNPMVPLFLLQPGGVGTGILTHKQVSRPERFRELLRALLETYPSGHQCCLLTSQTRPDRPGTMLWFPLGELCAKARHIHSAASLYVPASREWLRPPSRFVATLHDRRHALTLIQY